MRKFIISILFLLMCALLYRSYRQRVIANSKESVYQANGGYTFFVPVEEGFKVS